MIDDADAATEADDDIGNDGCDDADHDFWNILGEIEQIWGEILVKNAKGHSAM